MESFKKQFFIKPVLYSQGFDHTFVIQRLFSVFFFSQEIFCKGAQKFVSLSTLLINISDDKLILLSSKRSSDYQSTFSSCSDIIMLLSSIS